MNTIAVIGAGTMGNGIAHTFAQFGYNVALIDISQPALDKAMATIAKNLDRIVAKGYGETKPIANNESKEGRAKNRRVELKILN